MHTFLKIDYFQMYILYKYKPIKNIACRCCYSPVIKTYALICFTLAKIHNTQENTETSETLMREKSNKIM